MKKWALTQDLHNSCCELTALPLLCHLTTVFLFFCCRPSDTAQQDNKTREAAARSVELGLQRPRFRVQLSVLKAFRAQKEECGFSTSSTGAALGRDHFRASTDRRSDDSSRDHAQCLCGNEGLKPTWRKMCTCYLKLGPSHHSRNLTI